MPEVADVTMSLDGFVTGPVTDAGHGVADAAQLTRGWPIRTASTRRSSNGRWRRPAPW
jgi:hypothetical protein